jgi:hypothetical protein
MFVRVVWPAYVRKEVYHGRRLRARRKHESSVCSLRSQYLGCGKASLSRSLKSAGAKSLGELLRSAVIDEMVPLPQFDRAVVHCPRALSATVRHRPT